MDLTEILTENRLMAIIRGSDPAACERTAEVLVESGVTLLEVSLTSADAVGVLTRVCAKLGSAAHIGAGTVLSADDAKATRDAGATFAVTPALGEGVDVALELGLPVLAGAMTPTEVLAAHRAGATAVKLFPAGSLGPGYVKALGDPFPGLGLVPVGGVGLADVPEYLKAGALAVGVGSPLGGDAPHGGDLDALRERAVRFVAAARA
ncbi:bifunctional 4-hydroxy-2-oxoglutarate aldolase/2-dehydro-3-deoxy-phosphogluconate aldolase [Prauserella cavernicola]|uniref:Bifunctional 4-hydroxy-2-oxoglutarate aldolase/2-dehydro-3-deoxy-phosphogluconate aldolase n=1 Tax=Prauserella cavernicola TaxID=2800127 RepID=A0A934QLM5_9PSEU|nr:bifunctional 4-hydroxy-2-oxoglutarate aldolase/2-dehydro-3-deoxy-phosphogluconate aldolase [Prauserella cavernicola]MBK1783142.1 bifunctional 4-hydroxy-2-oxoglutarate aldolase/2-dehydro-3-deoxy-phosphogluconate aldolase [Prauserella cavernicola]